MESYITKKQYLSCTYVNEWQKLKLSNFDVRVLLCVLRDSSHLHLPSSTVECNKRCTRGRKKPGRCASVKPLCLSEELLSTMRGRRRLWVWVVCVWVVGEPMLFKLNLIYCLPFEIFLFKCRQKWRNGLSNLRQSNKYRFLYIIFFILIPTNLITSFSLISDVTSRYNYFFSSRFLQFVNFFLCFKDSGIN